MAVKQLLRIAGRETPVESLTFHRFRMIPVIVEAVCMRTVFTVDMPKGPVKGYPGDWLVKEVDGTLHICNSDVFYMTYDTTVRPETLKPIQG